MFDLTFAAAVAVAPALSPVPPNPCDPAESCRYVGEVSLRDPQGGVHDVKVRRWLPFLSGGRLALMPGEVVSVQLSDAGPVVTASALLTADDRDKASEAIVAPQQAQSAKIGKELVGPVRQADGNPALVAEKGALRIAFLQMASADMMLRITSGYDRPVTYRAAILVPGGRGFVATSVCPVLAQKIGFETWPPPILQILLSDIQLAEPAVQ